MIKLKLKFDVSFSKLALVFVGSAACYGVSQIVYGLMKTAYQENDRDFSDNFFMESKFDEDVSNGTTDEIQVENSNIKRIGVLGNH